MDSEVLLNPLKSLVTESDMVGLSVTPLTLLKILDMASEIAGDSEIDAILKRR